ncbi:MAG: hypothetical protein HQM12_10385, partial [SAR324 cluster bacterium]|nr:hypothetical protein [SAR324 cluster bacterium]
GQFVLSPNPRGQILAFERAYADASVEPSVIDYVECHATGTPLGDKVEMGSMDTFFGRYGVSPLIGSVKSNLGHLLTAAGMPGMLKVILSMSAGEIPPTINLTEPLSSPNQVIPAKNIPTQPIAWPGKEKDSIKHAGVSVFGFGGCNAHLIFEQETEESSGNSRQLLLSDPLPVRERKPLAPMAIIGMEAFFGSCHGLEAFHKTLYDGLQHFINLPEKRWKGIDQLGDLLKSYGLPEGKPPIGAYIDEFGIDFLRHKIPPVANDPLIPQQLLMIHVADEALKNAGMKEGGNVAVLIAMGTELELHQFRGRVNLDDQIPRTLKNYPGLSEEQKQQLLGLSKDSIHDTAQINQYTSFIGNIMASRISSRWDFTGPSFTISAEENSVFKALEVAQMLLDLGEIDAAVVGAVDLAGSIENVLIRNQISPVNQGSVTMSFDRQSSGWSVGEGSGAVVLKRADAARKNNDRIYAEIRSIGVSHGQTADSVLKAAQMAMHDAGVKSGNIEYLELYASGFGEENHHEIQGLLKAYESQPTLNCAVGSVKSSIGHTFAASGIASLIKTALCLHHRFIPQTPGWNAPKKPELWQNGPFYVPVESKTWFVDNEDETRFAAISGLGLDGTCSHLVLSEGPKSVAHAGRYLESCAVTLLPLCAEDAGQLKQALQTLRQELASEKPVPEIAWERFLISQQTPTAAFAAAVVGESREELIREIEMLIGALDETASKRKSWTSLKGSTVTFKPLGNTGKVAFVFPGGFNSYPGVGKDIFQLFPELHDQVSSHTTQLRQMVGERWLNPRTIARMSDAELKQYSMKMVDEEAIMMFESGITYAVMYTDIIREIFKVKPDMTLGYSMGEVTMMYAFGVWGRTDQMSQTLKTSPVFQTRLAGPMDTVREAWGISPNDYPGNDHSFWKCYTLKTRIERVRDALKDEPKVFPIIINTAEEIVIAGEDKACARVIQKLGCDAMLVPMSDVMHCELVNADHEALRTLHDCAVVHTPDVACYSAVGFKPLSLTTGAIAQNIADLYCTQVDFPRLVQQTWQDGARIFIELGPRGSCTKWIGETLKDQEHLAIEIDRRGVKEAVSIVRLLARLFSHRVPMDLSRLYPEPQAVANQKSLIRQIPLGGRLMQSVIFNEANLALFGKKPKEVPPVAIPTVKSDQTATPASVPQPANATPKPEMTRQKPIPSPAPASKPISVQSQISKPVTPSVTMPNAPVPSVTAIRSESTVQRPVETVNSAHVPEHSSVYERNLSTVSSMHTAFLETRQLGILQLAEMIKLQAVYQTLHQTGSAITYHVPPVAILPVTPVPSVPAQKIFQQAPTPTREKLTRTDVIWDQEDLVEFAEGRIGNVFGPEFDIIDSYHRRVRLPTTDYLLVTRVTKLDAKPHVFEPSSLTTEYDIPHDAWYSIDHQIPWAVCVESGQCDLLLISYLGIDFECKGERVYRLLDCTLTFTDELPKDGETLRYDIKINSFARNGGNLLFFFSYECFVENRLVLKMDGGCAGFFDDQELERGKGVILTQKELDEKSRIQKQYFEPLIQCPKTSFNKEELLQIIHGDLLACFGGNYQQMGNNPSLRFAAEKMLMIEQIVSIEPHGGAWGLGLVIADKELDPEHWYFPCHFKDDQVMAGSLMAEGCGQLLQFFMLYLGLQTLTQDARFQPIPDLPQKVRCRGQVLPQKGQLRYRMEVTEIGLSPVPYAKANVDILLGDKVVVDFRDLGIQLSEKSVNDPVPGMIRSQTTQIQTRQQTPAKPELFNKYQLIEFATGKISNCFGPEFAIYDNRQPPRTPNGDLQLIDRVLEVTGERHNFKEPSAVVSEYDVPVDAWYFRGNSYPSWMPYSVIMEISLQPNGFISAWSGTTLLYPEVDFYFRNLDGKGKLLRDIDLRGKTITNKSRLLSTVSSGNTIIQQFDFELLHDDDPFYQGTAVFGYFTKDMLVNQAGLDAGRKTVPWHEREQIAPHSMVNVTLKNMESPMFQAPAGKPHYRLADWQLNFLDEVLISTQGGTAGKGYIHGLKNIDVSDWFFPCHFHQDPVMPGSLGVESILQAMQVFCLQQGLGSSFQSPRFTHRLDTVFWKYRGQIIPANRQMTIEVNITDIQQTADCVTVIARANLMKDNLRIYEITDIALCVVEA